MRGQQLELFVLAKNDNLAVMSMENGRWKASLLLNGKRYTGNWPTRLEVERHCEALIGSKEWERQLAKVFQLGPMWHATIDDLPIGSEEDEASIKGLVLKYVERR